MTSLPKWGCKVLEDLCPRFNCVYGLLTFVVVPDTISPPDVPGHLLRDRVLTQVTRYFDGPLIKGPGVYRVTLTVTPSHWVSDMDNHPRYYYPFQTIFGGFDGGRVVLSLSFGHIRTSPYRLQSRWEFLRPYDQGLDGDKLNDQTRNVFGLSRTSDCKLVLYLD